MQFDPRKLKISKLNKKNQPNPDTVKKIKVWKEKNILKESDMKRKQRKINETVGRVLIILKTTQ